MEPNEIVLRAIGVLTKTGEWYKTLDQDVDAELEDEGQPIEGLIQDVFPNVEIPAGVDPVQAARTVIDAAVPAMMELLGAFAYLFSELAAVHDGGRSDIKTADLLRELGLRMAAGGGGESDRA